jgi:hypothetical protein
MSSSSLVTVPGMADEAARITGETIQVTGGSRIPAGYLTYMQHITQQLASQGVAAADPIAPASSRQ